jgi:hypothetical protein
MVTLLLSSGVSTIASRNASALAFEYPLAEITKYLAGDGMDYDELGSSVAISGDIGVVGAPGDDDAGSGSGSAYVIGRNRGGSSDWRLIKKLVAGDGSAGDEFGYSVAISDDLIIVGAWRDDAPKTDSGSAYIFGRDQGGTDNWGLVQHLTAIEDGAHDRFGESVAISGDTVVVGASLDDAPTVDSGSAYVFARDQGGPGDWGEVRKIRHSDAAAGDRFGRSVAVFGDTAVVGAWQDDDACPANSFCDSGSAYVFERNRTGTNKWGKAAKLVAADQAQNDLFGGSVAISGDRIVVGAQGDSGQGPDSGSAYVFERHHGGTDQWGQVKELAASDGSANDKFGSSVTVFGNWVVVGAPGDSDAGSRSGSAYLFDYDFRGPDDWGQAGKITARDAKAEDRFGGAVAISGETVVIGAKGTDDAGSSSGSAYVFGSPPLGFFIGELRVPTAQPQQASVGSR